MNPIPHSESRPEAMADVPGACELPLTRAVVQYRDVHEIDTPGGRIQDIGLAVVLEGRYASSAEVLDLGSGDVKLLDLSHELVVLDWVYEPTLDHLAGLIRGAAEGRGRRELQRFAFDVAVRVLERTGFSPLTRPALLRIGFRDLCRDLDLHDGTSVRILLGPGRVVRVHLDYEANALLVRTPTATRDGTLEEILSRAFPGGDVRRFVPRSRAAAGGYQIRFTLPQGLQELRDQMGVVRHGLLRLLTRFEPDRMEGLEALLGTFGQRETLARLRVPEDAARVERVPSGAPATGTVH